MAGGVIIYNTTLTTAGGTISENISTEFKPILYGGFLEQVYVKSASAGTIFDFYLTSPSGNIVYHKKNVTSLLNDISQHLPVRGIYTMTIANASADEDFEIELGFKEERI